MALKRQFGARDFDIDTMEGWVKYRTYEPAKIDLAQIADVMEQASYKLRSVGFEAKGQLEATADGHVFVIDGTEQRVRVSGKGLDKRLGKPVKLHLRTDSWASADPILEVDG